MRKLTSITPYLFEEYLLIALHPDWMKLFQGIPTFVVTIGDDHKLHLISQEVIKDGQEPQAPEKI